MSIYFKPYEGTRPFLFISYPHNASGQIVPAMKSLHDRGYRLWYDEGIPAGSDWPANIALHMSTCAAVIFFQTAKSLSSPNCFSEIRTAVRAGKPLLVIPLDKSVPDEKWTPLMTTTLVLPRQDAGAALDRVILDSGFVTHRFRRHWWESLRRDRIASAASAVLLLASAALFAATVTGQLSLQQPAAPQSTAAPAAPAETQAVIDIPDAEKYFSVTFPDTLQQRAVLEALGMEDNAVLRWQLGQFASLSVAGNLTAVSPADIAFRADGSCLVNGATVYQGKISDLTLFAGMLRLEQLVLVSQPLGDLSPLNSLTLLRELYLSGSTVTDLSSLRDLPALQELHLEHCPVQDLTPLESLPALRAVYVSADMLPLRWSGTAQFEVILVKDLPGA